VHSTEENLAHLNLLGESPLWKATMQVVGRVAATSATVLIEGETGTGKELVARAIHYLGGRRDYPFIPLNCGALPDALLESELFGHEKGSFTDARDRRTGLVAEANGGTLFLDEVEAMSTRAQVVLLRFLQDQTYMPVGARTLSRADVRIVAASNADLETESSRQHFRSDLLFRLRVLHVRLPPLRERAGDIGLLARALVERLSRIHQRPPARIAPQSVAVLEAHHWPGNVRELESVILREFVMHDGNSDELILDSASSSPFALCGRRPPAPAPACFNAAKRRVVADFEISYLRQLLAGTGGNISLAARVAGKDRSALNRLLKKHGIQASAFRDAAPVSIARA
jgi:DNA-binding NtrC family response regulator